ncbi:MAG TPA: hypothetical protein VF884_01440 [Nitrososphaeraceae archaeon]
MSDYSNLTRISDDCGLEVTETMDDAKQTMNRIWEIEKLARDEILILLSSSNAFTRQENVGSIEMLKELCLRNKDLKIRFLTPKSEHVEQVRSQTRMITIISTLNLFRNFHKPKFRY